MQPQNVFLAIFIGFLFTAMVQSSSVTTGLAIILTQQGMLGLENAVPIIMGANIGTTSTALLAVLNMDLAAKKAAFSHFLFNIGGVLLFLPGIGEIRHLETALQAAGLGPNRHDRAVGILQSGLLRPNKRVQRSAQVQQRDADTATGTAG